MDLNCFWFISVIYVRSGEKQIKERNYISDIGQLMCNFN